ncbi:hypothetical protein EBF16_16485 [Sphingobium yanoikuyae]|uniref:Uncharacterized protein n=2 Tax=Sphingobium yanoikuyae TaxID=13690 RepID=A0A3G2UTF6_SPHYA|nr:hypothetical protein EBF16_16485 [Sphingobium yanoikuyae]
MRPGVDFATGKLVEELGELQAALGKSIRWGRSSFNPEVPADQRETNADWIEREIDDVLEAIENYRREAGHKPVKAMKLSSGVPRPTDEDFRLAHAIVDSDPVLRIYAATEWDCLNDDGKTWLAVIIREARNHLIMATCQHDWRPRPFHLDLHCSKCGLDRKPRA